MYLRQKVLYVHSVLLGQGTSLSKTPWLLFQTNRATDSWGSGLSSPPIEWSLLILDNVQYNCILFLSRGKHICFTAANPNQKPYFSCYLEQLAKLYSVTWYSACLKLVYTTQLHRANWFVYIIDMISCKLYHTGKYTIVCCSKLNVPLATKGWNAGEVPNHVFDSFWHKRIKWESNL